MSNHFNSKRNLQAWQRIEELQEALLIGYFVSGDPDVEKSLEIVKDSATAGIDIFEIGIPSRNPFMDGAVIKRGHERVQAHAEDEAGNDWLMPYMTRLRQQMEEPIWAMGYKKELVEEGFALQLAEAGLIDGLVIPDASIEDQIALQSVLAVHGVDVVGFVNDALPDEEMERVCSALNILYAQLYTGTTGNPLANSSTNLSDLYAKARTFTKTAMIVAGFGLRSGDRVKSVVASGFEGAVVGSVLVARCETGEQDYLYRLISEMKENTTLADMKE
ncbi:tryptophan synthase subunit alpha [Paenibacillus terrigena]|uniref:tryptophan synthase subunit alpha n=1 Tax=Paenibacillus terrigena TaxID=369333 RepID=UPI00036F7A15|nr:tryptophan synthase subunit alpha [Paenibacillus terrigena]